MMIGWNCRSLNRNKILYVNYMIKIYNPEFLFICEAWLDQKKPTLFDNRYEIFQTRFKTHQGV